MTDEQPLVVEAPPRPTLKVLQALMQMKQEEYEQLRERHAELWQQRKAAIPRYHRDESHGAPLDFS